MSSASISIRHIFTKQGDVTREYDAHVYIRPICNNCAEFSYLCRLNAIKHNGTERTTVYRLGTEV